MYPTSIVLSFNCLVCIGFHCIPRGEGRNDAFSAVCALGISEEIRLLLQSNSNKSINVQHNQTKDSRQTSPSSNK